MSSSDLCFWTADRLAQAIRSKTVSSREVVEAHLARIARMNPVVNAICTLDVERARAGAAAADRMLSRGEVAGSLHGLPIAVKDLELTKGVRTTFGSPIYADHVPDANALFVDRLEQAGAIIIGKTNTPEFGAGAQTFNPVFGATRNPFDLTKTCGGSSGGAAVALACGMVPLADGSDLGGSVRIPPSFCNVVGLRTTPGRVPRWPAVDPWDVLNVLGPLARSVEDVALLLSVMAGPDARAPLSVLEPGSVFGAPLERDFADARIAWSPNLGSFPVERTVLQVLEAALPTFTQLGCHLEEDHPDFSDATEVFQILRAASYAMEHAPKLAAHRDAMKDTVIWNIERGLNLSSSEILWARARHAALYQRVRVFLETYDYLLMPVTQVTPFPVEIDWIREIDGEVMETYIDWMMSCFFISLTGLPAMSIPAGFTEEGLPVGLQIVGRPRAELEVLQLGYAFQNATRFAERHPDVA